MPYVPGGPRAQALRLVRAAARGLRVLVMLVVAAVPLSGSFLGLACIAPSPWQQDLRGAISARVEGAVPPDMALLAGGLLPALFPYAPPVVEAAEDPGQPEVADGVVDGAEPQAPEAPEAVQALSLPLEPEPMMPALFQADPLAGINPSALVAMRAMPDALQASAAALASQTRREPMKPLVYRVEPGDSLVKIASSYGITPESVLWANEQVVNGEFIQVGHELIIPPVSGILHWVKAGDTAQSVAESYGADLQKVVEVNMLSTTDQLPVGAVVVVPGGMKRTTEFPGMPQAPSEVEVAVAPRYVVQPGDNLVSIADAFGVLPSAIQLANDLMDPDMLAAGRELVIPGGKPQAGGSRVATPQSRAAAPEATAVPPTAVPPTAVPPTPTPVPSPTAQPAPQPAGGSGASYTVKAGDTLYSIARAFGVRPAAVQEANGMADPNALKVGQRLSIPEAALPGPAQAEPALPSPTPTAPPPTATPQPARPTATPVSPAPTATPRPPAPATTAPTPTRAPAAPTIGPAPPPPPLPAGSSRGDQIATFSQKYLGHRYVWGGHAPNSFDCSGFTWYVYREAGVRIPLHDLNGQLNTGAKVPKDKLLPGDLVFFENTYTTGLSHAGIYLGGGRFINAETEAVGVQIRSITDPFWAKRFVGASRPW